MTTSSDRQLVRRCRAGDARAWTTLVERHRPRLVAIAASEFRFDRDAAQDIAQDALLRAFARLHQLRDEDALAAWLASLARRGCLDALRRKAPTELLADRMGDPRSAADRELVLLRTTIANALGCLPDGSREVVYRFYICDESYATIAHDLGLPPGTIASRIARALPRLRSELEIELVA